MKSEAKNSPPRKPDPMETADAIAFSRNTLNQETDRDVILEV